MGDPALPYRMPVERSDELGNLARAFNDMTDRLGNAQRRLREFADSLEDAVKDKTAELEDTQRKMFRTEKMAAIGQMAAGVAHEINNPLTGVITFAHLLLRKADPESRDAEDLTTIIEEAERCSKIVRGLLDFARGGQLVRTNVDVNRVLDRIFSLVEHQASFHNIEIVRDYDPELPTFGLDQDRVEQVLLNLIMNAAEAMPSGGPTHRLDSRAPTPRRGPAHGAHRDPGHRGGHRPRDPQPDLRPLLHDQAGGAGHGARALGLVPDHRGPRRFDRRDLRTGGRILLRGHPPRAGPGGGLVSDPQRVLVVDDEGTVRHSCERIFEEFGIDVRSVGSAEAAFPILAREPFDAVVLDMMMPGMHGMDALAEIQRLWPGLSVIVITGYATLDMQRRCLDAGAAVWLSKPFGPDDLMAALQEAMRG